MIRARNKPSEIVGRFKSAFLHAIASLALLGCGSAGDSAGGSGGGSTEPTIAISLAPRNHITWSVALGTGLQDQQESITVQSYGNVVVDVTAQPSVPWLDVVGFVGGALQPQQSRSCVVRLLASQVQLLTPGSHAGRIDLLVDDQVRNTILVDLTVALPQQSGWTEFSPSQDSRIIYVSSSLGDDGNSGLSENAPRRTLAAGKALMRHGFPDWLLLRRGDTWVETLGQWRICGRSATEPMLVSSYGAATQRPLIQTGTAHGLNTNLGGGSAPLIDHVAIVGLHFQAHLYVGVGNPSGVSWLVGGRDLLIEDCVFERYQNNLVIQTLDGFRYDTRIRRNVIVDSFATTAGTAGQGLYMSGCDGVLIEDNIFDHCGWSESVPGANPSVFRHSIYIQAGTGNQHNFNVVLRGNIIANSAATGLQLRPGGLCEDNLFLQNPINVVLGGGHNPAPNGVDVVFRRNVVLDGRDIDNANRRGWSVTSNNLVSAVVSQNIIAHQVSGQFPMGVEFTSAVGVGVSNVSFTGNVVYKWGGASSLILRGGNFRNFSVTGNDMQDPNAVAGSPLILHDQSVSVGALTSSGNRLHSSLAAGNWVMVGGQSRSLDDWKTLVGDTTTVAQRVTYPDPERTIATYQASLGGSGGLAGFMQEARRQGKSNWRAAYTAAAANQYFRAGFGMGQ